MLLAPPFIVSAAEIDQIVDLLAPAIDQAIERFGEHGTVALIGINGYYTLLAMVMNAARTALPAPL